MTKDLKIGMVLGVVIVTAMMVWLCGRKELSLEARFEKNNSNGQVQLNEPGRFNVTSEQASPPADTSKPSVPGASYQATNNTQNQKVPAAPQANRVHVVQAGDSLSSISKKYYGTIKRVEDIKKANSNVIKKNNMIFPGMKLVIP